MRTIVTDAQGHAVINQATNQAFSFDSVEQANAIIAICWEDLGYSALEIDA